jgi:hypothetical protein
MMRGRRMPRFKFENPAKEARALSDPTDPAQSRGLIE